MKKGCLGGIPKLWRLYLLDISWGDMGIPKIELLSILHLISSLSIPYTWKLPSYKTSHNSISNISIKLIVDQPFWFSFKLKYTNHQSISYCRNFIKSLVIKRTQKESDREANTNSGRICQNRTADTYRFFRGPSVDQIEKCKTNGSLEITWGICTRNFRSKRYSENCHEFLRCSTKICFWTTTSPNLTSLKLEVLIGTIMK
jgi:hypothetical protein